MLGTSAHAKRPCRLRSWCQPISLPDSQLRAPMVMYVPLRSAAPGCRHEAAARLKGRANRRGERHRPIPRRPTTVADAGNGSPPGGGANVVATVASARPVWQLSASVLGVPLELPAEGLDPEGVVEDGHDPWLITCIGPRRAPRCLVPGGIGRRRPRATRSRCGLVGSRRTPGRSVRGFGAA